MIALDISLGATVVPGLLAGLTLAVIIWLINFGVRGLSAPDEPANPVAAATRGPAQDAAKTGLAGLSPAPVPPAPVVAPLGSAPVMPLPDPVAPAAAASAFDIREAAPFPAPPPPSSEAPTMMSTLEGLAGRRITGRVHLVNGAGSADLYMIFGRIFHATTDGIDGDAALVEALRWDPRSTTVDVDETVPLPPAQSVTLTGHRLTEAVESR